MLNINNQNANNQNANNQNKEIKPINTLEFYNNNASDFIVRTINADMDAIYDMFLAHITEGGTVLDAGCGSGRDSLKFKNMGYDVYAMDGSKEMVKYCQSFLGDRITLSTFEEYVAPVKFDGIWACASFLHIPRENIAGIVKKFASWLKPDGGFFLSFKYGEAEFVKDERYFNCYTENSLRALIDEVGILAEVRLVVTEDVREEHRGERWVSVIGKRV